MKNRSGLSLLVLAFTVSQVYGYIIKKYRGHCSVDGGWSDFGDVRWFGGCSVTCGAGLENGLSTRKCNNPTPQHGGKQCVGSSNRTESRPCRLKECPIDGEWSEYGNFNEWSACSVTCGNGTKSHERTRSCTNPEPQIGGKDWEGSEVDIQTESCDMLDCPVDGEWSEYGNFNEWSACSVTCGNGTKSHERTRSCTKPEPQFGGKDCEGSEEDIQTESCDMLDCPVDGEWSEYGNFNEWSACSVTCGNGTKSHERTRSCTKREPQFGGKDCEGSEEDIQTESCDMLDCPVDGEWSEYGNFNEWSACSVTCGNGTKSHERTRSCTKPEPQFGGKDCEGSEEDIQTESCDMLDCPVDGEWSEYGNFNEWSACSVTCGNGTKSHERTRSCTKPEPQFGGKDCEGSEVDIQTESCDMLDCPVDGEWSEYGNFNEWSACSVTCGNGTKSHERTRSCTKPEPQFGGKKCEESDVDIQTESCDMLDCPVDGEWSEYGNFNEWSACSVTCGNGTKSHERTRSCTKPEPQFGGKDCEGSEVDIQTESCDMLDCPVDGEWSEYGNFNEWSACSFTCGNGTKSHERTRSCTKPEPQFGGKDCEGSDVDIQTESCDMLDCPVDGEWSEYGNFNEWSACSVTCGNGTKSHERTRSCTKPEPQFGGKDCEGSEVDIQTESCDMLDCSVDGEWSEYGNFNEWSACSVTCGNGTKSHERTRSCMKPEPQFGGKDCEGSEVDIQTESCDMLDCPVDGEWSEYGNFNEWSACSVTCGNGTKTHKRTRSCTKPEPQFGGKACEGIEVDIQTESCDMLDCPELECTSDGLFADPKDCTKFIQCANNIKYEMSCPLTTHWEQTKGYCVHGDDCK